MSWIWFGAAVLLIVIELLTTDLVSVWFALAALVLGIIAAIFPSLDVVWQMAIFIVLSAGLLLSTRKFVKKILTQKDGQGTNLDLILNKSAIVIETIDNLHSQGIVKINGLEWSARAIDNTIIEAGTVVTVKEISGNKVFVEKNQSV
jgi:membrane protein implicated in regulation of membrane protease activity